MNVIWRKPVSTYAINACEALLASVNVFYQEMKYVINFQQLIDLDPFAGMSALTDLDFCFVFCVCVLCVEWDVKHYYYTCVRFHNK